MLPILFVDISITADILLTFGRIWQFSKLPHNHIRPNSTAFNSKVSIFSLHSSRSNVHSLDSVSSYVPQAYYEASVPVVIGLRVLLQLFLHCS